MSATELEITRYEPAIPVLTPILTLNRAGNYQTWSDTMGDMKAKHNELKIRIRHPEGLLLRQGAAFQGLLLG